MDSLVMHLQPLFKCTDILSFVQHALLTLPTPCKVLFIHVFLLINYLILFLQTSIKHRLGLNVYNI